MDVLIFGGTGVLGSLIVERLRNLGHTATPVGREVDVTDAGAVARHAAGHDVVVCAAPAPTGVVQHACAAVGVPSVAVDLGTVMGDAGPPAAGAPAAGANTAATPSGSAHVVGVGLVPGLSGLLAHGVRRVVPGTTVEVTLGQSDNARVGVAGMREMFRYIAAGHREEGAPAGRGLLRLSHPERAALATAGVDACYATRWETAGRTNVVRGLASAQVLGIVAALPDALLRRLARHDPARPETIRLVVRADGEQGTRAGSQLVATAAGDYPATAAVAVAVALLAPGLPAGVHHLWDVLDLDDIRGAISDVVAITNA
ncbi:hypothetical protein V2J52_16040 [Georgenia sp. MJ173]|uniref:hypothetical protein n=1 Tax=Georgenia sunbinii TaxID=3117728 RepID=UPI002F26DAE8